MAKRVAQVSTHSPQTTATLRAQLVLTRREILKDQASGVAQAGLSSHRTMEIRQVDLTDSLETQNLPTMAEQILILTAAHHRVSETLLHQYLQENLKREHKTHTQMLGLNQVQALLTTLTTPTIYLARLVPVTQQVHLLLITTVTQILTEALIQIHIRVAKKIRPARHHCTTMEIKTPRLILT